jgi:hypothetical protein
VAEEIEAGLGKRYLTNADFCLDRLPAPTLPARKQLLPGLALWHRQRAGMKAPRFLRYISEAKSKIPYRRAP